ncbi:MAG: glycogen synthase GlgA [Rhodobacteraceae bacterium]|nr:glycogen synthase GlgA [Paracoccaceae bacterium]
MIHVLSVASECAPLVKTGGLADVAGALPAALAPHEVTMRTLLPGYPAVMQALKTPEIIWENPDLFGGPARVLAGQGGGLDLLVLDAPHLFDRKGSLYLGPDGKDWPDNPERYGALCWVAAQIARDGAAGWQPDLLHLHDWQAGLTPVYLRQHGLPHVPTLLTIHNIAFQGLAEAEDLVRLRLPATGFTREGFEYWGKISALKAGLIYADKISTVSPTYAGELLTPEFGMGLDGVLRVRQADLVGILNGVDTEAWTPPYKTARGKTRHKEALREEFGLPESDGPLCVVVSRLTQQKGLDLLLEALPRLLAGGGQLALLGSGDKALEQAFTKAAKSEANVAVKIGYDEALSRRLIAGGDAILVPSRFEPCGLTQLYGLRFGTLPLVAYTGGLADTVIPASPAGLRAGAATGIQFHPVSTEALGRALDQLCALYREGATWRRMQKNAMAHPVGWEHSAADYADLYRAVLTR